MKNFYKEKFRLFLQQETKLKDYGSLASLPTWLNSVLNPVIAKFLTERYQIWFLPWIKASLSFDLDKIVFDSDTIVTWAPGRLEFKCVQMNVGETLNRLLSKGRLLVLETGPLAALTGETHYLDGWLIVL